MSIARSMRTRKPLFVGERALSSPSSIPWPRIQFQSRICPILVVCVHASSSGEKRDPSNLRLEKMDIWFVPLVLAILGVVAMSRVSGGLAVSVLVGTQPAFEVAPYQYLTSANGQYSLVMRPDCNLWIYNGSQSLLTTQGLISDVFSPPNCSLQMQNDGNLVMYNVSSSTISQSQNIYAMWAANYYDVRNGTQSFLLLGGDGRFDFYNSNSTLRGTAGNSNLYEALTPANGTGLNYPSWSASSETKYTAWKPDASLDGFPYMPAEYFLSAGKSLLTITKAYALELGTDCNLQSKHLSVSDGVVISIPWESGTNRTDGRICELTLQPNGTLQIRDVNSTDVYWNSTGNGSSDVSWILKVNPDNGSLSISDIQSSSHILWTNILEAQPPNAPTPGSQTSGTSVALIVGVVVGVVGGPIVLIMATLGLYFCARERFLDPSERAFQARLRAKGGTSYAFSQAKIKKATKNYENVIGRGGFGDVYKGKLPDGQEVAAKVLSANSHQSKNEFFNEIELLSMVHHKYLVSLVGYSCTRKHQVLIYEFMGGGDLRHRLRGESGAGNPLSWRQRTSIILQVAEGLEYLHDKCSPPIIHRDVKSSNILLTDQLVAKVADFGLSKLKTIGQEDATHVSTMVKGTPGYLDPEYHESGSLTEKSDVYAFGIVLMEILTGRPHAYIAQYVGEAWRQRKSDGLADPNLGRNYDKDELVSLVELALWCVRRSNTQRPFMRQVVRRLYDLGLGASSEPSYYDLQLGEENELISIVSTKLDSETQPFSESSSSSLRSVRLINQHSFQSFTR